MLKFAFKVWWLKILSTNLGKSPGIWYSIVLLAVETKASRKKKWKSFHNTNTKSKWNIFQIHSQLNVLFYEICFSLPFLLSNCNTHLHTYIHILTHILHIFKYSFTLCSTKHVLAYKWKPKRRPKTDFLMIFEEVMKCLFGWLFVLLWLKMLAVLTSTHFTSVLFSFLSPF